MASNCALSEDNLSRTSLPLPAKRTNLPANNLISPIKMAAPNQTNPYPSDFHFQNLRTMGGRTAVVFLPGRNADPARGIAAQTPLTLGDIDINNNLPIGYTFAINTGRLGYPAIELGIHQITDGYHPGVNVTFLVEPGQGMTGGRYHLQTFAQGFLGRPGGAGQMYARDAQPIRAVCERPGNAAYKQRILRVEVTIHGVVPLERTTVDQLLSQLPQNDPTRELVNRLRKPGAGGLYARLYCLVDPGTQTTLENEFLKPFSNTVTQRIAPLSQYTPVNQTLSLNMPDHRNFRNGMYYNRVPGQPGQLSNTMELLPDTQTRRNSRPVAITLMAGVIREYQAHNRLCTAAGNHTMRGVRTQFPILDRPARVILQVDNTLAAPINRFGYIGYVDNYVAAAPGVATTPKAGTMFGIAWQLGGGQEARGSGVVLEVPEPILQATNSRFVMLICRTEPNAVITINVSVTNATPQSVRLEHFRSDSFDQAQLDVFKRVATTSRDANITAWEAVSLWQPIQPFFNPVDLRSDPVAWANALTELQLHAWHGPPMSLSQQVLITNIAASMDCPMKLIQSTVARPSFQAILALVFQLRAVNRVVVLVIDNVEDRSWVCSQLRQMQNNAANAPVYGQTWADTRILAWATNTIDRQGQPEEVTNIRKTGDIVKKYLDELPQPEWLINETGIYWNAAPNAFTIGGGVGIPPLPIIPLDMSLGDYLQRYLRSADPAIRRQHFLDRQEVLDHTHRNDSAQNGEILTRYRARVRAVLAGIHVLVTDCETAASEDVRTAIIAPVTILLEAQSITESVAASVLLANQTQVGAFICGDGTNTQRVPSFISRGQNEAWNSYSKSTWKFMADVGTTAYAL